MVSTLTLAAPTAWAQDSDSEDSGSIWNFHVGAGLGVSKIDDTACDALTAIGTGTQQNCDDEDTGWKIYAGWQPLKNFALEAGYLDLGETTAKGGATNLSAEVDGWTVATLAFIPGLEKLGVYIKGGVYFYDADLSGVLSGVPVSADESDPAPLYGMGLRLPLNDNLRMNIEFERFLDIGDDATFTFPSGATLTIGETDVNYFSAGAVWVF